MLIENLTLNGGLTLSGTVEPPVVTSELLINLNPSLTPIPQTSQYYWPNDVNLPAPNEGKGGCVLLTGYYTWSSTGATFTPPFSGFGGPGGILGFNTINNLDNQNAYTIEVWFNPSSNPLYQQSFILSKYAAGAPVTTVSPFRVMYDATLGIVVSGPLVTAPLSQPVCNSGPITPNTWYQLVTVYNYNNFESAGTPAQTVRAYLNTQINGSASLVGVPSVKNDKSIYVGYEAKDLASQDGLYKGSIGIIRIYNKALSQDEIIQNFASDRVTFGI